MNLAGLSTQPESQHVGVGEDVTLTAVFKGDSPATNVIWENRTSAVTDKPAGSWNAMEENNFKVTTSAILYDTKYKTSTSTLLVSDVEQKDELDYRAVAVYTTGKDTFRVESIAVNIIIKCKLKLVPRILSLFGSHNEGITEYVVYHDSAILSTSI